MKQGCCGATFTTIFIIAEKPFHLHIQAKMNFFAGILEEVKVDCQAILTLWERQYDGWEEIIEFVLYERLLRYPSQHNATRNFDSGQAIFCSAG